MNNIPNYYNNIDLILDEIWSLLQRGVADRNEDFRLPVVIVSATDSAEGRIVVLRGAFKDKNILRFHTDFRSSKIKSFEWLYLASQGHRRAKFMLDENKSTWLVP